MYEVGEKRTAEEEKIKTFKFINEDYLEISFSNVFPSIIFFYILKYQFSDCSTLHLATYHYKSVILSILPSNENELKSVFSGLSPCVPNPGISRSRAG